MNSSLTYESIIARIFKNQDFILKVNFWGLEIIGLKLKFKMENEYEQRYANKKSQL